MVVRSGTLVRDAFVCSLRYFGSRRAFVRSGTLVRDACVFVFRSLQRVFQSAQLRTGVVDSGAAAEWSSAAVEENGATVEDSSGAAVERAAVQH